MQFIVTKGKMTVIIIQPKILYSLNIRAYTMETYPDG